MCDKYGGGLLATGSNSCILRPNIPCKNNKPPINDKKISKIVFGKKSKEYTDREKEIADTIKKIPGYKEWSLIFEEVCKPPTFDEAKKWIKDYMIVLVIIVLNCMVIKIQQKENYLIKIVLC